IEFVLPALFLVLVLEQYRQLPKLSLFVAALALGLATLILISRDQMLLISCSLAVALLLLARGGQAWKTQ
ncbi:MAG TPA: branched-chain amino acid transporter AzlC, partial [Oceanospirillaceae bacterium]|nr:branched-chain amino acid transporter AzlC [Oceanospirillaceae bacterium]